MPVESLPATAATIAFGDLYVVSGCSGSGKSTLIAALAEQGEAVSYEPGGQIVQEQMNVGGDGLQWKNLQRLKDLCAARAIGGNSCPLTLHLTQRRRPWFLSYRKKEEVVQRVA